MEYYSSETCFMEELLLVKDMEYYPNVVEDFNNLDSYLATNNSNIISCSNAHCFEDNYSNFPIDNIQTFNFPGLGDPNADYLNTHLDDFQQDIDKSSIVVPNQLGPCKDEAVPINFNVGFCPDNESKSRKMKKVNGQPSKNLMAERRRRKRLNDRLSMLRSVVPKISKMDRTSILGDTIDYMRELLERISNLQEEMDIDGGVMTVFNDAKPKEILVRNSPKMEVERGDGGEMRIKICCAMKPGLLLSTMNTVELELGLHIQQCVISCFSDFTMQASCSSQQESMERDAEDVKQALFRNAAGISLTSTFV